MYIPSAFRDTDLDSLHQQIEQTRLAVLVTHGQQGLQASHLPLLLKRDEGPNGTLYGHLAKANPQWQDLATGSEALLIFAGADAYVSPNFYPSKAVDGKAVPTWNYLAVHAYGCAEVFDDPQRLHPLLDSLSERHERGRPQPWSIDDAPVDYINGMLKAIVGFALPIERLQGKRKTSQNRNSADIEGVRKGLSESPDPLDKQLAALMRQP